MMATPSFNVPSYKTSYDWLSVQSGLHISSFASLFYNDQTTAELPAAPSQYYPTQQYLVLVYLGAGQWRKYAKINFYLRN